MKKTYLLISLCCAVCILLLRAPLEAAEQAQSKPAEQEQGIIKGRVFDSQTGQPIRAAIIKIVGIGEQAMSDINGEYVVKLPAGTYDLRASGEGYFDQPIEKIAVQSKQVAFVDAVLVPKNVISEKVVVEADSAKAATIRSVLLERQTATTIVDNVSAEDISKNPDGDAAAVLERVTGISVVQDKFVYVRGLGERYSATMVNGSMIPSTEPEKKVVAFDMFPASLINEITTLKSYSPDEPGDFSGALVKVETTQFPPEFKVKYSMGVGYNTNVSTQHNLSYRGGHLDWIGYGVGSRSMPGDFPEKRITKYNDITGSGFSPQELQHYGLELKNEWEAKDDRAPIDMSQSFTAGGTYKKLGAVFSLTYGRKYQRQLEEVNSFQALNGDLLPWNSFTNDKNGETVKLGLVGNIAYRLTQNNKLQFKNFYTRDSSDETRFLYGYSTSNTADERDTRLRYSQEAILASQVSGDHYLPMLGKSLFQWRFGYSNARRDEPDLRETTYRSEKDKNQFRFSTEGQSGFRQFGNQEDRIIEPGIDWSYFLVGKKRSATIKFGGLYHKRLRDFSSRRFIFQIQDRSIDLTQQPEQLFARDNIAPGRIELREITRSTDTYDADQEVYAGYSMAEVRLSEKWRFIGGARYENSKINLKTYDPYAPAITPLVTNLHNSDFLPAVSAVFLPKSTMIFRAGFSRTLNRPEFREMAPFQFTDISGRSTLLGNPNLQEAHIANFDARFEWFPKEEDLYAISLFNKRFTKPIERVLFYAADILTSFANIDSAANSGLELELKKGLGFLSHKLDNFNFYSNYSRIRSNIVIGDITGLQLTSLERPMQGQSKYLFNSVLEYANPRIRNDFRILYNLVGPRISEVGATQLPDVYEQANHYLDFSYGQTFAAFERFHFKFSIQNILNRPITHLQGSEVYYRYRLGRTFGLGVSYDVR